MVILYFEVKKLKKPIKIGKSRSMISMNQGLKVVSFNLGGHNLSMLEPASENLARWLHYLTY